MVKKYEAHRMSETLVYKVWGNMKSRCSVESTYGWNRYGGRGISVCDRWKKSFTAFTEDMGPRPSSKHFLDRIDNDGNYCPENCQWATAEQQQNNKCNTVYLEYKGEVKSLTQWARLLKIKRDRLRDVVKKVQRIKEW